MKYSCMYVDRGITFFGDSINICCKSAHKSTGMPYLSDYKNFDIDKILETKRKYRQSLYDGVIPQECDGCCFIKETDHMETEDRISFVDIASFTVCNSRCVYCDVYKADFIDRPIYHIMKDLFDRNLIQPDKYGYIQFAGGEPTIMKDFEKIIDLCIEHNMNNYMIHSNGIAYSKAIVKLLENNYDVQLIISLDSGTKETFEKVKNVPCFDKVVENMGKYVKAQKKSDISVRSKFIIIPGVNDDLDEILKWYDLSLSLGVKMLIIDVERAWFKKQKQTLTPEVMKLIKTVQNKCKEDGIILDYYESLKIWFSNNPVCEA